MISADETSRLFATCPFSRASCVRLGVACSVLLSLSVSAMDDYPLLSSTFGDRALMLHDPQQAMDIAPQPLKKVHDHLQEDRSRNP